MTKFRKDGFVSQKMLSSRVELSDYIKLEEKLSQPCKNMSVQKMLNAFVRSVITGSIQYDESSKLFVGVSND